jgi:RimJ/RimL family protein N-acetyltransferase
VRLVPYLLADGTEVQLRPVRAEDKRALKAAFDRLSPETVRLRFLAPKTRLSTAELRYLTEVDGRDHVAIAAVLADDPRIIVGVGRYVRLADQPDAAEVAIVIGDPFQSQGLGRHMGLTLADIARRNGIRRFTASLLSENRAAHRLFERISQRLHAEHHHGVEELVAELAA